jgi:hypothetical protein
LRCRQAGDRRLWAVGDGRTVLPVQAVSETHQFLHGPIIRGEYFCGVSFRRPVRIGGLTRALPCQIARIGPAAYRSASRVGTRGKLPLPRRVGRSAGPHSVHREAWHSITPRGFLALSRQFPDLCVARPPRSAARHAPVPSRRLDKFVPRAVLRVTNSVASLRICPCLRGSSGERPAWRVPPTGEGIAVASAALCTTCCRFSCSPC